MMNDTLPSNVLTVASEYTVRNLTFRYFLLASSLEVFFVRITYLFLPSKDR